MHVNRMWNSGRVAAAAAAVVTFTGALAISGPAQAAPSAWSAVNGAATASGTLEYRAATGGRYADVAGAITVGDTDGQCYYLRYYVPADLLGSGFNSPRHCGEGTVPVESHVFLSTFLNRGFRFGLCRVAPGTPEESSFAELGAHCVRV
jgi:hypothetical protein